MKHVLLLILPELGWDCVVGVFDNTPENYEAMDTFRKQNPEYTIRPQVLQENFNSTDWE